MLKCLPLVDIITKHKLLLIKSLESPETNSLSSDTPIHHFIWIRDYIGYYYNHFHQCSVISRKKRGIIIPECEPIRLGFVVDYFCYFYNPWILYMQGVVLRWAHKINLTSYYVNMIKVLNPLYIFQVLLALGIYIQNNKTLINYSLYK